MKGRILVKTSIGKFRDKAKAIADLREVKCAFLVIGRSDVVVWKEVSKLRALGRMTYEIG